MTSCRNRTCRGTFWLNGRSWLSGAHRESARPLAGTTMNSERGAVLSTHTGTASIPEDDRGETTSKVRSRHHSPRRARRRPGDVPDIPRQPGQVPQGGPETLRGDILSAGCPRLRRPRAPPGNEGRVRCRARPSGQGHRLLPPPRSAGVRTTGHSPGGSVRESSSRAGPPEAGPRRAGRWPQGPRGPTRGEPAAVENADSSPQSLWAASRSRGASRSLRASTTSAMPGRRIGPEILAQLAQTVRVVAAGGHQGDRVE